jgi:hypothetical protein
VATILKIINVQNDDDDDGDDDDYDDDDCFGDGVKLLLFFTMLSSSYICAYSRENMA